MVKTNTGQPRAATRVQNGQSLEDDLARFHASRPLLYVHKNHPAPGFRGKGPPDFVAVVDGRPVLFDAKSIQTTRWPVDLLAPHQAAALEAFQRAGGDAAIFLRLIDQDRWVTWAELGPLWQAWWQDRARRFLDGHSGVGVLNRDWTACLS